MVTTTPAEMREMLGETAPIPAAVFDPPVEHMNPKRPLRSAELDAAAELVDALEEKERLKKMADVVRAGGTVMPVDADVAHAQRIGRRELERRRARRKAAANARKRNR